MDFNRLATGPRSRLWERRPTDPDWLELRLGTADLPSEVMVDDSTQDTHLRKRTWTAPDVPATAPLVSLGVLGVAGPNGEAQRLGAWLTGQLAALHSPRTLRLMVLCPPEAAGEWQWTRWLPHLRGTDEDYLAWFGNDDETTMRRIGELTRLVEPQAIAGSAPGARGGNPGNYAAFPAQEAGDHSRGVHAPNALGPERGCRRLPALPARRLTTQLTHLTTTRMRRPACAFTAEVRLRRALTDLLT